MSKGNPFLALRLPRDQQDALRVRAAEAGITVSELARKLLGEQVAGQDSMPAAADGRRRTPGAPHGNRSRRPSRPKRLQQAIRDIEDLLADYEAWRERLPDSLDDTPTAIALTEAIDNLAQALELLTETTPPRGFGRD